MKTINLERPWRRVRMADLVEERTGWKFDKRPLQEADPDFAQAIVEDKVDEFLDALATLSRRVPESKSGEAQEAIQSLTAFAQSAEIRRNVLLTLGRLSPAEQL